MNKKSEDTEEQTADAGKAGPRKRRDSSLYRGLKKGHTQDSPEDIQRKLQETAEQINALTAQLHGQQAGPHGYTNTRWEESGTKFVLKSKNPEVVPVNHQAVIEELTASLDKIDEMRHSLETQLAAENSGNKLQIAQLKGRLADLARRKKEIESLLSTGAQ